MLPPMARVLRVSPNLPCVVQEGAMVMARGCHVGSSEARLLRTLLEACGQCEEVCAFSEALAEGAIKMGMPSGLAHRIAAQTLLGTAKMLLQKGQHPAQLRTDVCTPGGTTIYGLHALEQGGLRAAAMSSVEAATCRARELSRNFPLMLQPGLALPTPQCFPAVPTTKPTGPALTVTDRGLLFGISDLYRLEDLSEGCEQDGESMVAVSLSTSQATGVPHPQKRRVILEGKKPSPQHETYWRLPQEASALWFTLRPQASLRCASFPRCPSKAVGTSQSHLLGCSLGSPEGTRLAPHEERRWEVLS
ncbi:hypothetical protein E2I00_000163 [Balaenoptera physalus]|uniref:pyrroline-5-carboxylate reductase n=1 Tax=Balaenoptera physalus TaxID=9770 RepID=A0A6A1QA80_BALPH|nr:hypothetical protein E2I00_000163 [Balaenoptera physalus]